MRDVVYTACAGAYEDLKPHPQIPGVDWIAFTDGSPLEALAAGWEHRPLTALPHDRPRMRAKWYKLHPEECGEHYARTLWVDASVTLLDAGLVKNAMELASRSSAGIALPRHPTRDCIYDEALACHEMPKYAGEPVLRQVWHYRNVGHPPHWGLWACGLIARHHASVTAAAINRAWWNENMWWSWQDQLSFPFVLRRLKAEPEDLPLNVYSTVALRWHWKPEAD